MIDESVWVGKEVGYEGILHGDGIWLYGKREHGMGIGEGMKGFGYGIWIYGKRAHGLRIRRGMHA